MRRTVRSFACVALAAALAAAVPASAAECTMKPPGKLKQVVLDAGRSVEDHVYEVGRRFATGAEQNWRDGGAEVIRLSDADQKRFMEIVQPIGDGVLGRRAGTKAMFELMKKTAQKYRGS